MRDALAERLLANVMEWTPRTSLASGPSSGLAAFKYDEYQQFSPGMRFVESLALWLEQFTEDERKTAYEFVLSRLVFLSARRDGALHGHRLPGRDSALFIEQGREGRHASSVPRQPGPRDRRVQAAPGGEPVLRLRMGRIDSSAQQQGAEPRADLHGLRVSDEKVVRKWLERSVAQRCAPPRPVGRLLGSGTSCLMARGDERRARSSSSSTRIQQRRWKSVVSFPKTRLVVVFYVATAQALPTSRAAPRRSGRRTASTPPCWRAAHRARRLAQGVRHRPDDRLIKKYYDPLRRRNIPEWGKFGFGCKEACRSSSTTTRPTTRSSSSGPRIGPVRPLFPE